jgi:general secretion pathway protein N
MIAKKHWPVLSLLAIFVLLAVMLLMPLGFAAQSLGVAARNSQGTIMSGALRDVSIGRIRIGDVNARLDWMSLITGRFGFALERGNAAHSPGISGVIGRSSGGIFADQLTAAIDGKALVKELDGAQLYFEKFSVRFSNGQCSDASGAVRLSLNESALGAIIRGGMIGNAECRQKDLFLPLMSQSTMERAFVRIKPNGQYLLTLTISEPPADMANALTLAGFQPVAGGFRIVRSGRLN